MLCHFVITIPAGPDDEYDLLVANGEYLYTVHSNGSDSGVVRNEPGERNIGVDVHFGLEIVCYSEYVLTHMFSMQELANILVRCS